MQNALPVSQSRLFMLIDKAGNCTWVFRVSCSCTEESVKKLRFGSWSEQYF